MEWPAYLFEFETRRAFLKQRLQKQNFWGKILVISVGKVLKIWNLTRYLWTPQ